MASIDISNTAHDHSDETKQKVQGLLKECETITLTMGGTAYTNYELTFADGSDAHLHIHYRSGVHRMVFDYWSQHGVNRDS